MTKRWLATLATTLQLIATSLLLWASAGYAEDVAPGAMNQDNFKKIRQAKELEKGYIAKLQLVGKNGRQGLATMLDEGFRCGIDPETDVPLPVPAVITCIRDMSFLQGACADVSVSLFPKWVRPAADVAGLFEQLDDAPIEFASVFCPYRDTRSEEYLRRRAEAGAELAKKISELGLARQRADEAFRTLLIQGFRCGLVAAREKSARGTRGMECTRVPSQIDFCYHARLSIDLSGGQSLHESSIAAVHSSCDLPLIEGQ